MTRKRRQLTSALICAVAAVQLSVVTVAAAATLPARPLIALTFDDAPQDAPALLLILTQKDVKATFFVVGQEAELKPAQMQAIASAGMLIANHSYDHSDFATATADEIRTNLMLAQAVIQSQTGTTPRWYRSPYNTWNSAYNTVLPELGLTMSWPTINPKDWRSTTTSEQIISAVLTSAAPGGNVELHDMADQTNTIEALPVLIDGLHAAGYELATVAELGRGVVEGSVTTTGGAAMSGAQVTVYNAAGSTVATASTDARGVYRIGRLTTGTYRVGFSAEGFDPVYYGGAIRLAQAEPIAVANNYAVVGVDAALDIADVLPPATLLTPPLPGDWVNHDVSFTLTASDAQSPQGTATYMKLDPPGSIAETTGPVTISREGETAIAYWSVDEHGNAEATATATVRIDKTPPETSSDATGTYATAATVSLAATDAASGVAFTRYSLDGGAETSATSVTVSAPGAHTLSFWSIDAAGNAESPKSAEFAVVYPTHLSLQASSRTPSYGSPARLRGVLRSGSAAGAPIAGQRVYLQTLGSAGWVDSRAATTTADGLVEFKVTSSGKVTYRLRFEGAPGDYHATHSERVVVTPKVALGTPVAPKTARASRAVRVHGSLKPKHAQGTRPVRIYLYRRVAGRWQARGFVKAKVYDYRGYSHYRVKITFPKRGTWRIRAMAPADSRHATTWSRAYDRVVVR